MFSLCLLLVYVTVGLSFEFYWDSRYPISILNLSLFSFALPCPSVNKTCQQIFRINCNTFAIVSSVINLSSLEQQVLLILHWKVVSSVFRNQWSLYTLITKMLKCLLVRGNDLKCVNDEIVCFAILHSTLYEKKNFLPEKLTVDIELDECVCVYVCVCVLYKSDFVVCLCVSVCV